MSSSPAGKFQDHYLVLGVEASADSETIQRAYTKLAARYHTHSKDTADPDKFQAVTQAYEVLSDPAARATFDSVRSGPAKEPPPQFSGAEFFTALAGEMARRQCILCLLYDRRRTRPLTPSLSARTIESMMKATQEEIQFSLWYLKQRGLAVSDDKSNVQISVQGMEHLERELPAPDSILSLLKCVGTSAEPPKSERSTTPPRATPADGKAGAPETALSKASPPPRRTIVIPPRT
jgi:curved DNA-binding protein CbpA